tara:strand:- start:1637 stop:2767 length:1131 start_codon:yes stop_codon:yes gene_type:complete
MYKLIVYPTQELAHFSYLISGLVELEKEGYIKCEFSMRVKKDLGRISCKGKICKHDLLPQPKTSFYEIIDRKNKKNIKFAIDLYDIGYSFSNVALKENDYVFKRNYVMSYIKNLPIEYQKKIIPFGIPFPVNPGSFKGELSVLAGYIISKLILNIKMDRSFFFRIYNFLKITYGHIIFFKNQPNIDFFDNKLEINKNKVFYQKRLFIEEGYNKDVQEINLQRYLFVKRLKDTLSDEIFLGGLVANKLALKRYPSYITKLPNNRKLFYNAIKEAGIVIYTRGLEKSPGWTLPEYLSLGKAILAEKHENIFSEPLVDGKDLIYFEDINDCMKKLKDLINDQEKINILSKNAKTYFETNLIPKINMKRVIKVMLNKQKN